MPASASVGRDPPSVKVAASSCVSYASPGGSPQANEGIEMFSGVYMLFDDAAVVLYPTRQTKALAAPGPLSTGSTELPSVFQPGASTSARTCVRLSDAQTEALSRFYSTRSKRPTHEERVVLSRETGVDTERINRWYVVLVSSQ